MYYNLRDFFHKFYIYMSVNFYDKYLKYKKKYIELKKSQYGARMKLNFDLNNLFIFLNMFIIQSIINQNFL